MIMGRITAAIENQLRRGEKALIPFITAGDPDLQTTEDLIHVLVEAGADVIELGFPFSDPMADGPTIQLASERALLAGTTLDGVLDMIGRVREHTNVPIVLMGYYNPIFRYGPERFANRAAEVGVDGLLLVDLPAEESGELEGFLRSAGIDQILLLAPTTPPARRKELASRGQGFIYYVSMTGVTGVQTVDPEAIRSEVEAIKAESPVPVGVGFGISNPQDAAAVGAFADAVVVGSALVKVIEAYSGSERLKEEVHAFVSGLKAPLRKNSSVEG